MFSQTESVVRQTLSFIGVDPERWKPDAGFRHRAGSNYVAMNPETRQRLTELFKPYNRELSTLLDRDFDWD